LDLQAVAEGYGAITGARKERSIRFSAVRGSGISG